MSSGHDDANIGDRYTERYTARREGRLYPVEFVVRMLLGKYPRLTLDRQAFAGARILDLGCGDGRNVPLLADLGFEPYAVEITDEICEVVRERVGALGVAVTVKTGSNSSIPFDAAFFDYVLACHSLYYVQPGQSFNDTVRELARVVRTGGTVIASLPKKHDRYTLRNAQDLGDNHLLVRADPLGLRNGSIFRVFESPDEIEQVFGSSFHDFQVGWIANDFFGIEEQLWIVAMRRS